jgi:hypothetical protein
LAHTDWRRWAGRTFLHDQISLFSARQSGDARGLCRLPLIAVIGVVFYGESLDLYLVLGAVLILLANYLNLKRQA